MALEKYPVVNIDVHLECSSVNVLRALTALEGRDDIVPKRWRPIDV